jgi:glycosyltransferase involved in cell wall biosynthesis
VVAPVTDVRTRVLVVTTEPLKEQLAGPAIRAWETARTLAAEVDVTLVTMSPVCRRTHQAFRTTSAGDRELRHLVAASDVVVFQGTLLDKHPWLRDAETALVADVYDPFHLEVLEQLKDADPGLRARAVDYNRRSLNTQLQRADLVLCASRKQRDFWLGHLASLGRINPLTYDADPSLQDLVTVVPFGVPDAPPQTSGPAVRGVVPGIDAGSKLVLWGGGVYNWFDPLSLIRAVHRLSDRRPEVRLLFLGMRHPNPEVAEMRAAVEARELAAELGIAGTVVHFNEDWVPYDRRQDFLLEADLGVSTHFDHVETAFSFRTRILDYLWAGLPVVATGGDSLGDLIERQGLGRTVPADDVDALEQALEEMLYDDAAVAGARARVAAVAETLRWSEVLRPLREFCRAPRRAADRGQDVAAAHPAPRSRLVSVGALRHDVGALRRHLAEGGVRHAVEQAGQRVRRVLAERRSAG